MLTDVAVINLTMAIGTFHFHKVPESLVSQQFSVQRNGYGVKVTEREAHAAQNMPDV